LNISHAEPFDNFLFALRAFVATILSLCWRRLHLKLCLSGLQELGIEVFTGSSGRIFPAEMKAAPLLRAWVHRLRAAGVIFHMRHQWLGWTDGENTALKFATPEGERKVNADAVVLALGGGSWPQLGSTGAWVPLFVSRGVSVAPLRPSNCGFDIAWSEHFRDRVFRATVKISMYIFLQC